MTQLCTGWMLLAGLAVFLTGCDGTPTRGDRYPGDTAFNRILQELRAAVAADDMDFPWGGQRDLSRAALCELLAGRHFSGQGSGQGGTQATWLACPGLAADDLARACQTALTTPMGFSGPAGWQRWQGRHRGTWHPDRGTPAGDDATWHNPRRERTRVSGDNDAAGAPRDYDFQDVVFDSGRRGWNQSHADVPYVWGWDPKEGNNENGQIGAHLGFPFSIPPCHFIVWVTKKEAFLEGINRNAPVDRTVGGNTVRGYPKTSTGFHGRGQWVVQ